MRYSQGFFALFVSDSFAAGKRSNSLTRMCSYVVVFGLLAVAATVALAQSAFGQIQSTMSCPEGHGYWDVLSVMMMDPGLASNYHMEGLTGGLPSSYVYTIWDQSQSKVYYVKNPQGNPWDINLYDSNFIYQWVTELGMWHGVNHWNDPTSCKKFNNGSQNRTADLSMRWAARCAVPGEDNSAFWNPPPSPSSSQLINTNYYTYVGQELQSSAQNLNYSLVEVLAPATLTISDHRAVPPRPFSITTLPLQYTYSCTVSGNVNSCMFREVFDYGVDTDVNPVDRVKHSYGWVRWRYYTNSTGGSPKANAAWVLANTSNSDHLMAGRVSPNFQCF
jgi:hypothetical protein